MESARSKPRWLVIGVGNDYRGDDAVGLAVARRIRNERLEGVTVREASGEGLALMEIWQVADSVILIDAVHSGARPGTVHRFDAGARPLPAPLFHYSTHAFGLADAIELARALNQLPSRLEVYGVEGKNFEAGAALSPEVEAAARRVSQRVRRRFRESIRSANSEA